MGLRIGDGTIIYVACPPAAFTGGPEGLHQLAGKLRGRGLDARMHYVDAGAEDPVHPNFKGYDVPWERTVVDSGRHVLVVPETFTHVLARYPRVQKVLWWLSIDNYYKVVTAKKRWKARRALLLALKRGLGFPPRSWPVIPFTFERPPPGLIHLYQSEYAHQHLLARGVNHDLHRLSDFLTRVFLAERVDYRAAGRSDHVLYNPLKGLEFTRRLKDAAPDLGWRPIEKMTPAQVQALLKESKVYVDFGNHPGKDRFPREAAISGCCVLTGRRGSAAFEEDVAIPPAYKFDEDTARIADIVSLIRDCLARYDARVGDFAHYRDRILGEEAVFEEDVRALFVTEAVRAS